MAYSTHFLDFKRVLKELSSKWSGVEYGDEKVSVVADKIEEAKKTMKENINKLLVRDEEINELLDKTSDLDEEVVQFKKETGKVEGHMRRKNRKICCVIVIVVVVIALLLILVLSIVLNKGKKKGR